MGRQDDTELDKQLRETFRRHADDLVFTRKMQEDVLQTIEQKTGIGGAEGRRTRSLTHRLGRRTRLMTMGTSAVAACVLLVVWGVVTLQQAQRHAALGTGATSAQNGVATNSKLMPSGSHGMIAFAAPLHQVAADIPASLAPVQSNDLKLTQGITQQALEQQGGSTSTASGTTSTSGAGAAASKTAQHGSASAGDTQSSTSQFVQLAKQEFTVSTQLYNNSDKPLPGNSLQGMLFILKNPAGLTPDVQADWEYFVDGPLTVIPPHKSVSWYFTPNPAPPFRTLTNRTAHLIWMFRTPDPQYPTLYLGTLPVQATDVQLQVTGETVTAPTTQFLRVTARLTNEGTAPWDVRSALGLLFFARAQGVSLLSRGTYKYFDDIAPVAGSPYVLKKGQSGDVQFVITGVPGTDMTRLPLTILLVARNQIGA